MSDDKMLAGKALSVALELLLRSGVEHNFVTYFGDGRRLMCLLVAVPEPPEPPLGPASPDESPVLDLLGRAQDALSEIGSRRWPPRTEFPGETSPATTQTAESR